MNGKDSYDKNHLLVEYQAANDVFMHYDNFAWNVGGVLIAGAFIFWGFLINKDIERVFIIVGSFLMVSLMSVWRLFCDHVRQHYKYKLHRLHEIEKELGFKQHVRFGGYKEDQPVRYKIFGFRGHTLNSLIYLIVSIGTPIIGYYKVGPHPWLTVPPLLALFVLLHIRCNNAKVDEVLNGLALMDETN